MAVRIRGISYHFDTHGSDSKLPTLILLHGFLGSGRLFDNLIPSLRGVCNPVSIDLLGHGQTEGAELHYRFSTQEQVADLAKLIGEQFELPVFLYGYSMGARLALNIALYNAELLQGLVLESGTFGIEDETERQARQSLDAARADQILGTFTGFLDHWNKLPMFDLGGDLSGLDHIQQNQNPIWMANSLLGFGCGTMPCLRPYLPKFQLPVQLIAGELDPKFIRINQTMLRELPDARLAIIPGSTHRVHANQPNYVAETIKDFITNHPLPNIKH